VLDLPTLPMHVDRVVVAVPDDRVAAVAGVASQLSGVRDDRIWFHLSGVAPLSTLGPVRGVRGACHPLQSLSGSPEDDEALRGAFFAVDGESGAAVEEAAWLVGLWSGEATRVGDAERVAYHVAAVLAGNGPYALVRAAFRVTEAAGIESPALRRGLAALLRGAADVLERRGPAEGLTGPFARGDAGTVARHVAWLRENPEAEALYQALAEQWLDLSAERGLGEQPLAALAAALHADERSGSTDATT
jgi:predicted short-subunit dehydrogenase-like oxidoreductase (DUF2520 family)